MPKRKKSKGAGGRRPARQRTQVQHYTDDIPGTFTKKKKRGREGTGSDDDSGSSGSESDRDDSRRQQQQQQMPHASTTTSSGGGNGQGLEWNGLAAAKHKRQRPTKSSTSTTTNAGYNGHKKKHSGMASSSLANNKNNNHNTMKLQELPPSPPPQNVMLPHTGSIAPILPLATTCPLARHSLAQQYPVVFGRGLGAPNPPPPPEWKHVPQYDFYFPEDYTTVPIVSASMSMMEEEKDVLEDPSMGLSIMEQHRKMGADGSMPQRMAPVLKSGPWPVCRVVTSVCSMLSSSASSSSYMAVGDSAGFVVLTTSSGPRGVCCALARLNTSASRREHARQREIQSKIEQQCRHKPELLEQRSAFWATAKTPNAIESLTWVVVQQQQDEVFCAGSTSMIIIMTASEIECLKLSTANAAESFTTTSTSTANTTSKSSNQTFGGNQNCEILWTMPVTPTMGDGAGGPRKNNGTSTLLNGGEFAGSCLELHHGGNMVLWNTWGVAPVVASSGTTLDDARAKEAKANANSNDMGLEKSNGNGNNNSNDNEEDDESPPVEFTCDWPLLLMHNADSKIVEPADFVKIIPFQRQEEEETPPPVPIKRSPGRPPKKKPKPKVPVAENELVWTESSKCKCHAAIWDNNNHAVAPRNNSRHARLIIAYSTAAGNDTQAQLQLALLVLTDDSAEQEAPECSDPQAALPTTALTSQKAQYARVKKQTSIPLTGGPRNTGNVPEVTLQQSPKGTYTLVAGSSGVRMYETETMTLLRVYGENVSLHGKAMVWKSCFVLDNRVQQELYRQQQEQFEPKTNNDQFVDGDCNDLDNILGRILLRQNRQGFVWMEQDNPLSSLLDDSQQSSAASHLGMSTRRSSPKQKNHTTSSFEFHHDIDDDESSWLHQAWIVGIPHPFRGPKELQETLYFWQGPEKLPLFTLALPHNCGGVQSIHPLPRQGERSNSMWQKLMVATVHGECFELAPSLKSEFAGNMYNPGYCVIEDNIEYIEDEDELDKVMVEVPEDDGEGEEDEELMEELEVGVRVGGDIVDAELAEAIRLSLLESKHKSNAAQDQRQATTDEYQEEEDSTVVVVKDDFDDEGEFDVVIPCEPEPFLRQKVLLDLEESEKLVDNVDASAKDKSAKDAEFASKVMPILPQSKFAHRRWEKQKSRIEQQDGPMLRKSPFMSQKPQGAAGTGDSMLNQPASKLGRGKRSKAGNLGALLEASIVPELRQYMMDRDRLWVEGTGASLLEDAWDETASKQNRGNAGDQEHHSTNGNRTEALPVELQNTEGASSESNNGRETVMPKYMSPENSTAAAAQPNGLQIAIIELQDFTDVAQQYSRTATIEIPLTLGDCGSSAQASSTFGQNNSKRESPAGPGKQRETGAVVRCAACHGRMVVHSCGKRALPVDFEALAIAEKEKQEREDAERKRLKIEKRKMAEVKRREAKKRKKEIERQEKLAKEEELRRKQDAEIREARARMANIGEYLDAGSPNGRAGLPTGSLAVVDGIDNGQVGASSVHLAIADAWKEHAQQFSSNTTTNDSKTENSPRARSDAVAALAIMAEGATQQAGMESLFGTAESAKGKVNIQEQTSVAAEQKRVVHGFFSQEDAYPQHLLPSAKQEHQAPLEASSAARRQKVLNSYHDAIARGTPTATLAPGASGATATNAAENQSSVNASAKQPQATPPQRNDALSSSYSSAGRPSEASTSRPYFGYTQFSGNKSISVEHTAPATKSLEATGALDARKSAGNASAHQDSLDDAAEPSLPPTGAAGDSNSWSKPSSITLNWQAQAPALNQENGTPTTPNTFVKNS